jgi:hypothetical protein
MPPRKHKPAPVDPLVEAALAPEPEPTKPAAPTKAQRAEALRLIERAQGALQTGDVDAAKVHAAAALALLGGGA